MIQILTRFLALTLLVLPLGAMAQPLDDETPLNLTTHDATLRAFTEAMEDYVRGQDDALKVATACLWLEELPEEVRATEGATLAEQLFDIIDSAQFRLADFEVTGPDNDRAVALIREDPEVRLVLKRNEDGRWRFNYTETLQLVPEWHEAIAWQATVPPDETLHPLYWSPRATMRAFIYGMHQGQGDAHDAAIRALDLSEISESLRTERGANNADVLKFILDRHAYVWLYGIPNHTVGPRYVHLERPEGSIIISRNAPPTVPIADEAVVDETDAVPAPALPAKWLFTAGTLRTLETLQTAFQTEIVAEGVSSTSTLPVRLRVRNYIGEYYPILLRDVYIFQLWQWLGLVVVVFAGWVFSRIIGRLLILIIDRWVGRRKNEEIQRHESNFVKPIRIGLMSWVWLIGLQVLDLPDDVYGLLQNIAEVITVVAIVWAGYRAIDVAGAFMLSRTRRTTSAFDDLLVPIVTRTVKIVVVIAGGLILADIYDLPVSKVVAGLGIGGLAVAFAAQQTISNFFGSLTILLDQPFQIGDWVVIDDVDGSVESVGLRSTRIRTFYNSLVTVPNSTLMSSNIDNYGKRRYRRIKTYLGLTYDTPPDKIETFCEGVREIIRSHPYTRKDYYHVYFNQFNSASLDIMLYCFVECPDWGTELRERERLFLDILRLADELGVEFAFPTQTLHLRNEEIEAKPHDPSPRPRAFRRGRRHAQDIVGKTFGDATRKPPPVTFESADGIESDILEAGFDDGES